MPRSTLDGQMRKSFYQRFLHEAEAASQLDHLNILSIYAYGEHEGMPYMSGGTLSEYIRQYGPLSSAVLPCGLMEEKGLLLRNPT